MSKEDLKNLLHDARLDEAFDGAEAQMVALTAEYKKRLDAVYTSLWDNILEIIAERTDVN